MTQPRLSPLEMALNAARAVERSAQYQQDDPLGSYIARAGEQGQNAAHVAACMAIVSMAEDIRRIADLLERGPLYPDEFESGHEPG
jgi:hypothetical protein